MQFRRRREEPEIPTASMADIAFLLIVFFMLTTVFAETRGINFKIPPPSERDQPQNAEREEAVHIKIDPSGRITIDDTPVDPASMDSDIVSYLMPKLRSWAEKPILVTSDKSSPYGRFVGVYDALRQAEVRAWEEGILPRQNKLKISIPSLKEIDELKAQFGEDIFG